MATEYLVPNGNDGGWDVSTHTNIDNGILGGTPDDGAEVNELTTENAALLLDLADSAITDADTVTQVEIRVRARSAGAGNDRVGVELFIGGTGQGATNSGSLTASFVTYVITNAAWDVDWTAAQLDGAQVQLTSVQSGMPATVGHRVSEVEVDITYTEAPADTLKPQIWM